MNVLTWESFVEDRPLKGREAALTIGVFDGVHRGHRALVDRVTESPWESAVLTFSGHPVRILGGRHPGEIQTTTQKLETFEDLGVDHLILIDFSGNFSKLAGEVFLDSVRKAVSVKKMIIGPDFRCGHRGHYDIERIRAYGGRWGFPVEVVPPVFDGKRSISSTRIREAVRKGRFDRHFQMAGRPFELDLRQVPMERRQDVWTGEIRDLKQILPPAGEYPLVVRTARGCEPGVMTLTRSEFRLKTKNTRTEAAEFPSGTSAEGE